VTTSSTPTMPYQELPWQQSAGWLNNLVSAATSGGRFKPAALNSPQTPSMALMPGSASGSGATGASSLTAAGSAASTAGGALGAIAKLLGSGTGGTSGADPMSVYANGTGGAGGAFTTTSPFGSSDPGLTSLMSDDDVYNSGLSSVDLSGLSSLAPDLGTDAVTDAASSAASSAGSDLLSDLFARGGRVGFDSGGAADESVLPQNQSTWLGDLLASDTGNSTRYTPAALVNQTAAPMTAAGSGAGAATTSAGSLTSLASLLGLTGSGTTSPTATGVASPSISNVGSGGISTPMSYSGGLGAAGVGGGFNGSSNLGNLPMTYMNGNGMTSAPAAASAGNLSYGVPDASNGADPMSVYTSGTGGAGGAFPSATDDSTETGQSMMNSIGTGLMENVGTTLLSAIAPPLGLAAKLGLAGYNLYNKLNPATQANTPLIDPNDITNTVPDSVAVDNAVQMASSIQSPSDTMAAISAAAPSFSDGDFAAANQDGDAGGGRDDIADDQVARGGYIRRKRNR
jgi:hypothetical protein